MSSLDEIGLVLDKAKAAAIEFYRLTGKPLGITGELGEYLVAKHLDLTLADAREPGFDAVAADGRRIQIKARAIDRGKPLGGQRIGSIRLEHEWDSVVLVLMSRDFEPLEMFEADRPAIEAALNRPGSRARNERGALAISNFKSIGRKAWPA